MFFYFLPIFFSNIPCFNPVVLVIYFFIFNINKYIPTGQQIPPGLHIEMNLETGEKRAKLLEPVEDNTNNKIKSLAITNVNTSDGIVSDPCNMISRLIIFNFIVILQEEKKAQPVNSHEFKSYETLKDDLKQLNLVIKSDIEVMNDLSIKFTEQMKTFEDSESNLKNILIDLEYLLHQVDTAEVFVNNKGQVLIIDLCAYYLFCRKH